MNAHVPFHANAVAFASAYRQLQPVERVFVDSFIADLEREYGQRGEHISLALGRPVDQAVVTHSRDMILRPLVQAAIVERIGEIARDTELSAHRVVKEISVIAFSNIKNYFSICPNTGEPVLDLSRCTEEQLSAIQSFEIDEKPRGGRTVKFRLHGKIDALKLAGQYMGLFDADNPHYAAEKAKKAPAPLIPANASEGEAGDMYARAIEGD